MLAEEHALAALEFLEKADNYFEECDQIQASEKLWSAAAHAVMAVIDGDGRVAYGHRELKAMAERLALEHRDPLIASGFSIAGMYYHDSHHAHLLLDGDEWLADRPKVGNFVARVLALRNDPGQNGQGPSGG